MQDKRRDEETAAFIREYRQARGRLEAEIQRRKEHQNDATNFQKARGFVRTCWKTKNWNPDDDPTKQDSSSDSEDQAEELAREEMDRVDNSAIMSSKSPMMNKSMRSNDTRDNFDKSVKSPDSVTEHNRTRLMTDSKVRRKMFQNKPEIINIEDVQDEHSSALPVHMQIETLEAIKDYNKSLPLKRRTKDALPEIKTHGLSKIIRVKKDYKKDKNEVETFYKQIGNADEGEASQFNPDKFSLSAKTRAIQRSQSQQKIAFIRTSYANLLGITPQKDKSESALPPAPARAGAKKVVKGLGNPIPKAADGFTNIFKPQALDNPFTQDNYRNQISLSCYNRPKDMADRRPRTSKTTDELVRRLPGYKVQPPKPEIGEDGEPLPVPEPEKQREPILPPMKIDFQAVTKD